MHQLQPWQKMFIENMMQNKALQRLEIANRNAGKSHILSHAIRRLIDDMLNRPVENLIVSEGKIYGALYYCIEPIGGNWAAMEIWCTDTFGDVSDIWQTSDCGRWYMNDRKFWFRNLKDRDWFILKWNS